MKYGMGLIVMAVLVLFAPGCSYIKKAYRLRQADPVVMADDNETVNRQSGALTFRQSGELLFAEPQAQPRLFEAIEIRDYAVEMETARSVETVDGGRVEAGVKATRGRTKR